MVLSARPPPNASGILVASTPASSASRVASATAMKWSAHSTWLISLVVCPAPEGPMWVKFAQRWRITAFDASKSSPAPPAMTVSRPARALGAPPERGQSTHRSPMRAASAASVCVEGGSIDDMSMIRVPGFAPPAAPCGPKTASRTIAAEFRLRIT